MTFISTSSEETKTYAKQFAAQLKGGDIVCLYGDLGAGKTTFVKGLAEGLGIKEDITSPTFTLMNVYRIPPTPPSSFAPRATADKVAPSMPLPATSYQLQAMVHIDTYRLKDEKELFEIGAEDYVGQPNMITLIEWPEKISGLLKNKKCVAITIEHREQDERKITVT